MEGPGEEGIIEELSGATPLCCSGSQSFRLYGLVVKANGACACAVGASSFQATTEKDLRAAGDLSLFFGRDSGCLDGKKDGKVNGHANNAPSPLPAAYIEAMVFLHCYW